MMLREPTEQPTVLRITALNCLIINNKQPAYLLKDEMLEIKKMKLQRSRFELVSVDHTALKFW